MKKKPKQRRAVNKKPAFLKALAICGSIMEAAAAVKIDRSAHYEWLKSDPTYPARFAEAKARGEDSLEDEATSRATRGVYEPNVYQGRFQYPQEQYEVTPAVPAISVEPSDWKDLTPPPPATPGTPAVMAWRDVPGAPPLGVWRKSDALLMFRLRGSFAKYRQNFTEITGANGGPIAVSLAEVLRERRAKREASEPTSAPSPE
jgi:hypothetical protein